MTAHTPVGAPTADTELANTELRGFYQAVAAADLQPLWLQEGLLPSHPPISDVPFGWRWTTLKSLAQEAGRLVPVDSGGDRRVLALANPGLAGQPYATRTLWGAVQYLGPHEFAPAHRHTPAAIRFVLEGTGVWTGVDGDRITMHEGDLILTPNWTWHEHRNTGDKPMLWFDGLDLPMVRALDAVFFEPGNRQAPPETAVDERSAGERGFSAAGLRPEDLAAPGNAGSPLRVYRWAESSALLDRLADQVDTPQVSIRYCDPVTGADPIATMRCSLHRVAPGARTSSRRRVGSSVGVVHRGRGRVVVGGLALDYEPGDMFAVPSWSAMDVQASETTWLFTVSDAPVLEALRLTRTETMAENQAVTGPMPTGNGA